MGERGSKMGKLESKMGRFIKHKSKAKAGKKANIVKPSSGRTAGRRVQDFEEGGAEV